MDAFFCSVEVLKNSALQGRPLIIGGQSGRGVVASCSYEARHYGVHSAMPMRTALQRCPEAIVISGDRDAYSHYSQLVTDIIAEAAPCFEKASIDEFYCDLSGMDRFMGCMKWSGELGRRIVKESGLSISYAVSLNKLIAKMGTSAVKPHGRLHLPARAAPGYIAPMSVRRIPSLGQQTYERLTRMGVRTIRVLRQVPVGHLEKEFGKPGRSLHQKAQGIDLSPVVPYSERKSISTEKTFGVDTTDARELHNRLLSMTEKLCFQLRQQGKVTSCVSVRLRYSDFNTVSKQRRIFYTAQDATLLDVVRELFNQLYERRLLVRMVGVRFTGLVAGHHQINLFEDTTQSSQPLSGDGRHTPTLRGTRGATGCRAITICISTLIPTLVSSTAPCR